jgi:hypothetical protein
MSLILQEKINNEIISFEIKTIHEKEKNKYFLAGMFDYNLIKSGDIDELIKLFYFTGYQEDFEILYSEHSDNLRVETKIYLLNNAYRYRSDHIIKKYIVALSVVQINTKINQYDENILQHLCAHGSIAGGDRFSYTQKRRYPIEDPELLAIVEFVLQHKPQLIDEKCYSVARYCNNNQIIKLLNNYKIDDKTVDDTDLCYICNSYSEPDRLINDICMCKMNIHHHCAQELILSTGNKCKTCNSDYKCNMKLKHINMLGPAPDNKIYFPHLGIFPIPLWGGKYQIVKDKGDQLVLSIIYLQFKHIKYLFDTSTPEEIKQMKIHLIEALSDPCNGFGQIIDGKFKLLDNTCSNAPKELNFSSYLLTETLLLRCFIN